MTPLMLLVREVLDQSAEEALASVTKLAAEIPRALGGAYLLMSLEKAQGEIIREVDMLIELIDSDACTCEEAELFDETGNKLLDLHEEISKKLNEIRDLGPGAM